MSGLGPPALRWAVDAQGSGCLPVHRPPPAQGLLLLETTACDWLYLSLFQETFHPGPAELGSGQARRGVGPSLLPPLSVGFGECSLRLCTQQGRPSPCQQEHLALQVHPVLMMGQRS